MSVATHITVDISEPLAGIEKLLGNDVPFTIARFLTMCAQDGQEAARTEERSVFKLRNDWTTQNTKIKPATKTSLLSQVYTDTTNRKSGAPDYLPGQQSGQDKVPVQGHQHLAVPTRYLRAIAPGVIPAALRPKALLPQDAKIGAQYTGRFGRVGKASTPYPRNRRQAQALGAGEYTAFLQKTQGGTLCIFVRHGGLGTKTGPHDAEPWYVLIADAHIKPIFPMDKVVQQTVEDRAHENFDRAATEVLLNNALGRGFSVRL